MSCSCQQAAAFGHLVSGAPAADPAQASATLRPRTSSPDKVTQPTFLSRPRAARRPPLDKKLPSRESATIEPPCERRFGSRPDSSLCDADATHVVTNHVTKCPPLRAIRQSEDQPTTKHFSHLAASFEPPCEQRSGDRPGSILREVAMLPGERTAREVIPVDVAANRDPAERAFRMWSECTTTTRVPISLRDPKVPSFDERASRRMMNIRRTVLQVVPATKAP